MNTKIKIRRFSNNEERDRVITQTKFMHLIRDKLKDLIDIKHINSIVGIFFEEIKNDILDGKEVRATNVGFFKIIDTVPRYYHNIKTKIWGLSKSHKLVKFYLPLDLKKIIVKSLDLDKTFGI